MGVVATATSTSGQQTNGTTQINGQDQRANGQNTTVQMTPTPAKSGSQNNQSDNANSQNSTVQATPTPAANNNNTQSSQDDQSSSQKSNTQDTSTTTTNNGNSQAATPTTTSGSTMYITTRTVTINGSTMNVLATGTGMTLYYRSSDPAPASSCTGNCAATWPPLLNNSMTIITSQPLTGQLTVQQTANGPQVEYNGRPLYTYVGDTAVGQANGNGLGGVWYPIQIQPARMHW
jgi:predicted lipoprotein with Yx(FWY)xxD motif